MMKLYWSSRSPFVRKVTIMAHEVALAERITCVPTKVSAAEPNAVLMADNPLNKLPTLVLDDGTVIYDSRVICEYLDTLHGGAKMFPAGGPERLAALRRQAHGDGMMDVLLAWLGERGRPVPQRSDAHICAYGLKVGAALDVAERDAPALAAAPFGIGHIAIGCALSYLDFRFDAIGWRNGRPQLKAWHEGFAARPSVLANKVIDA
jgi:glutathione S-transferase